MVVVATSMGLNRPPPVPQMASCRLGLSGTMVLENRIFLINGSKIFDTGIGTTQKSVTVSIFASDTRIIVRYYKALPDVWTKSTSGYLIVFWYIYLTSCVYIKGSSVLQISECVWISGCHVWSHVFVPAGLPCFIPVRDLRWPVYS